MSFDNFVQIAVTVKSLTDAFMRIDREGKGYATIGYEQVRKATKNEGIYCLAEDLLHSLEPIFLFISFRLDGIVPRARCYEPLRSFLH